MKLLLLALWVSLAAAALEQYPPSTTGLQRRLPLSDLFVKDVKDDTVSKKDKHDNSESNSASYYYYYYDAYGNDFGKGKGTSGKMNMNSLKGKGSKSTSTRAPNSREPPREKHGKGSSVKSSKKASKKKSGKGKHGGKTPDFTHSPVAPHPGTPTISPGQPSYPTVMPPTTISPPHSGGSTPMPPSLTPPTNPGGPGVVQLTSFSIEYDIAPTVIPPISEIEAVAAATTTFLRDYFEANVPGFVSLGINYVGEALAFPTYTIDYEAVASVSDGSNREDLDLILDSAFQGASLQAYIDLIADLPGSFSNVQGVRKVATPENRSSELDSGSNQSATSLPVPLLAGVSAASFVLITLGIVLHRREKRVMREGKKLDHHAGDITLAGDTFAGETATDTVYSADKTRSSYTSRENRNESDHISEEYRSDRGSEEDGGESYEESKTEIDDGRGNQYGDIEPIDDSIYEEAFSSVPQNPLIGHESNIDHTFIAERAAYLSHVRSGDVESVSTRSGRSGIASYDSNGRTGHSTSSETSIHILETATSDEDFGAPNYVYLDGERQFAEHPGLNESAPEALYQTQAVPSFDTGIASKLGVNMQETPNSEQDQLSFGTTERSKQPDPPQERPEPIPKTVQERKDSSNVAKLIQKYTQQKE